MNLTKRFAGLVALSAAMTATYFVLQFVFTPVTSVGSEDEYHRVFPDVGSQVNENYDWQILDVPVGDGLDFPELAFDQPLPVEGVPVSTFARGGERLSFSQINDLKLFELFARPVRWNILDEVAVTAYTYNGMIPAPLIIMRQGERARIALTNGLSQPTNIQWRGLDVTAYSATGAESLEIALDVPIVPDDARYYQFTAAAPGTYPFYAWGDQVPQSTIGMAGLVIIRPVEDADPPDLDLPFIIHEWRIEDGSTYPTGGGAPANYFTMNGKAFPSIPAVQASVGDTVRLRMFNVTSRPMTFLFDGLSPVIIWQNGATVAPADQTTVETVTLEPGENVDVQFVTTQVGDWSIQASEQELTSSGGTSPGGLIIPVSVVEAEEGA